MNQDKHENKGKKSGKPNALIVLLLLFIAVAAGVYFIPSVLNQEKETQPEIITTAKLEKIVDISELTTFQAIYNGVAQVMNDKKPEKTDYYVSYEAKVDAGFNFEDLEIINQIEEKKIIVNIPEISITTVNVKVHTLDYIFVNEKADTSGVSSIALIACEEDALFESQQEQKIYELAKQNARNIVEALIRPFIEEFDSEYELIIN